MSDTRARLSPFVTSKLARLVPTLASLTSGAAILTLDWRRLDTTLVVSASVAGMAGFLVHGRHLAARIAARGIWVWAAALGAVSALYGPARDLVPSWVIVGGALTALVASGTRDLASADGETTAFSPRRWRAALIGAMVLLVASGVSTAFFGLFFANLLHRLAPDAPIAAAVTSLYVGSAVGILRMRTWGVILGAATAVLTLALTCLGSFPVVPPMQAPQVIASGAILALLSPLLVRAVGSLRMSASVETASRVRIAAPASEVIRDQGPEEIDEPEVEVVSRVRRG